MKLFSLFRKFCRRPAPLPAKKADWKITGVSVPGAAHVRRGRGCEDAVDWFVSDDLLGIAVADGAGSASQSARGSALAVRTAIEALRQQHQPTNPIVFDNAIQVLKHACRGTQTALVAEAKEMGIAPRELATTLIIVVANRNYCAALQVGDGAVVIKDRENNLTALTTPINGRFANETAMLGYPSIVEMQISILNKPHPHSIAVFTDGLQRLALEMPLGVPHAPFFLPLFEKLQRLTAPAMECTLKEFLNSSRVNGRTDDDKTVVTAQIL